MELQHIPVKSVSNDVTLRKKVKTQKKASKRSGVKKPGVDK